MPSWMVAAFLWLHCSVFLPARVWCYGLNVKCPSQAQWLNIWSPAGDAVLGLSTLGSVVAWLLVVGCHWGAGVSLGTGGVTGAKGVIGCKGCH